MALRYTILNILSLAFLYTLSAGIQTSDQCNGNDDFDGGKQCTKGTGNNRSIANRVSPPRPDPLAEENVPGKFSGSVDVFASDDGSTFSTNILCTEGQAWPRISEGLVVPEFRHPSFMPLKNVFEYLDEPCERFISYNGVWIPRTFPGPGGPPSGGRQNGAYIWLSTDDTFDSAGNPEFPFSTEINIWVKHVGGPPLDATKILETYKDGDDEYNVAFWPDHPDGFRAVYLHEMNGSKTNMVINIKTMFSFLLDHNLIDGNQRLTTIDVAAEGICPADGKFEANIETMGSCDLSSSGF